MILTKLKHAYIFLGTTILSVALILFAVESVSCLIMKARPIRYYKVDSGVEELLGLTSGELEILGFETWENVWQYEPWVGFKERPKKGKYVNVCGNGYRKTKDSPENPKHLIIILGGSTTFGFNVTDEQTIASCLQVKINSVYSYGQFGIRNYGRGYYYSQQELILLEQLIRGGLRPAIALFLDGLNEDQSVPYYTYEMNNLFDVFQNKNKKLQFLFGSLFDNTGRLLEKYKQYRRYTPIGEAINASKIEGIKENYLFSQKTIKAISQAYNIIPYFFIQPVPGYKNNYGRHYLMPKDETALYTNKIVPMVETLSHLAKDGSVIDISSILLKYDKQPFVDQCHYAPEVNAMIAEIIFEHIKPSLDKSVSSDNILRK